MVWTSLIGLNSLPCGPSPSYLMPAQALIISAEAPRPGLANIEWGGIEVPIWSCVGKVRGCVGRVCGQGEFVGVGRIEATGFVGHLRVWGE